MDLDSILKLIEAAEQTSFDRVQISQGDFQLRLVRSPGAVQAPAAAPRAQEPAPATAQPSAARSGQSAPPSDGAKEILAPLIGIFHALPEGRQIRVGSHVQKGDIICMIEAMKLMNEVAMPEDGTIVAANAKDGDMVEYGQVLFCYTPGASKTRKASGGKA